jgi:hypothetical protein
MEISQALQDKLTQASSTEIVTAVLSCPWIPFIPTEKDDYEKKALEQLQPISEALETAGFVKRDRGTQTVAPPFYKEIFSSNAIVIAGTKAQIEGALHLPVVQTNVEEATWSPLRQVADDSSRQVG